MKLILQTAALVFAVVLSAAPACGHSRELETLAPLSAVKKLGRAREAVRAGRPEEALSLLYNLENELTELKPYVFFIRGDALEKMGSPAAAEIFLRAMFHPSNPLSRIALEKAAESFEKRGRYGEAEKTYKTLLDSDGAGRRDFYLKKTAEIAAAKGEKLRAARIWETLWKDYPAGDFAEDAPDETAALGFDFSPSERVAAQRADKLFELGKWEKALAAYETLPENPQRNLRRAWCVYKIGAKDPERLKKALSLLDGTKSADGLYRKAVVLEAAGNISDGRARTEKFLRAAGTFRSVHGLFPDSKRAGQSLIRAQRLLLGVNKTGEAREIYSLIKKFHPERKSDAGWVLGWAYYKNGNYAEAERIFSENRREKPQELAGQFQYWTARALEKTGKKSAARKIFLRLAERENFSYYSFLASEKTGFSEVGAEPAAGKIHGAIHPAIKRARLLLEAGMRNWAGFEARIGGRSSAGEACEILAEIKRFDICISLAVRAAGNSARLSFPKGFEREVRKFSAEYGLDENLVYSLIREESRFDARAVSRANALGLMQLIMPTAKEAARRAGVEGITREKLFLPEINIKLGAYYLSGMLEKFEGDRIAALAGYNAGPSRVARWKRQELKNLEPDEFAEAIPFRETRNYVRRVLRSCGAYKVFYKQD